MYVLGCNAGSITAKAFADSLGFNYELRANNLLPGSTVAIRYGNGQRLPLGVYDMGINTRKSILRMSAKNRLSDYLEDTGIVTPKYYTRESLPEDLPYPLLTRNKRHRAGKDIKILYNKEELDNADFDFIVQFYPTLREYRVHVFDNKVIKVFRKYPEGRESKGRSTRESPKIRTSIYGWEYVRSDLDQVLCSDSMVTTALEVCNKIGCVFGAIDMAWSRPLECWIVWEINSAPSLNSSSLELYAELTQKLLARRQENVVRESEKNYDRNLPYNNEYPTR